MNVPNLRDLIERIRAPSNRLRAFFLYRMIRPDRLVPWNSPLSWNSSSSMEVSIFRVHLFPAASEPNVLF